MEVNVAINIEVESLYRGANVFREGGRELKRGGENISSWGEEIFHLPGDSIMGVTLCRDTGCCLASYPGAICFRLNKLNSSVSPILHVHRVYR